MNRQIEAIREFLRDEDLCFSEPEKMQDEDRRIIELFMSGRVARWLVRISVVKSKAILVKSEVGFNVPEARRKAMLELIARANFGLLVGGWDLDLNDGEILYRSATPLDGSEVLAREILRHTFYANLSTFERYFSAI